MFGAIYHESVPSESRLRKTYLSQYYDISMKVIQDKMKNIWISIDESTEPTGCFIINVIVALGFHSCQKSYNIVENSVQRLKSVAGEKCLLVREKCKNIFSQNHGSDKLWNIFRKFYRVCYIVVEMGPTVFCFQFAV